MKACTDWTFADHVSASCRTMFSSLEVVGGIMRCVGDRTIAPIDAVMSVATPGKDRNLMHWIEPGTGRHWWGFFDSDSIQRQRPAFSAHTRYAHYIDTAQDRFLDRE